MSEKKDEIGIVGKIFSTVFTVSVVFWLYSGGWDKLTGREGGDTFSENSEGPKTFSSPGQPAGSQPVPVKSAPVEYGIAVFTSSIDETRSKRLFFSKPGLDKKDTIARTRIVCGEIIKDRPGQSCRQISHFSNGCFVRYRVANGHNTSIKPSLAEADREAREECRARETGNYECKRDAAVCTDGSIKEVRQWFFLAVGLSPVIVKEGSTTSKSRVDFDGKISYSSQDARQELNDHCQSKYGSDCRAVNVLDGDQCVSYAYSAYGAYSIIGGKDNGTKAKKRCENGKSEKQYQCAVKSICASL